MPFVREAMTAPLVAVDPHASLVEVAQVMRDQDLGEVLVVDDEQLVGLVTDRDLVVRGLARMNSPRQRSGPDPTPITVGSVCSRDVVSVAPEEEMSAAAELMRRHGVRRLPVVDGDQVVGIVSLGDLAVNAERPSALADISSAPPTR